MFVDFFIRRPIFATVCALMIILAGAVSIPSLPIAQFPALAPPQVTVLSNYIGASAQVGDRVASGAARNANVDEDEDQLAAYNEYLAHINSHESGPA